MRAWRWLRGLRRSRLLCRSTLLLGWRLLRGPRALRELRGPIPHRVIAAGGCHIRGGAIRFSRHHVVDVNDPLRNVTLECHTRHSSLTLAAAIILHRCTTRHGRSSTHTLTTVHAAVVAAPSLTLLSTAIPCLTLLAVTLPYLTLPGLTLLCLAHVCATLVPLTLLNPAFLPLTLLYTLLHNTLLHNIPYLTLRVGPPAPLPHFIPQPLRPAALQRRPITHQTALALDPCWRNCRTSTPRRQATPRGALPAGGKPRGCPKV